MVYVCLANILSFITRIWTFHNVGAICWKALSRKCMHIFSFRKEKWPLNHQFIGEFSKSFQTVVCYDRPLWLCHGHPSQESFWNHSPIQGFQHKWWNIHLLRWKNQKMVEERQKEIPESPHMHLSKALSLRRYNHLYNIHYGDYWHPQAPLQDGNCLPDLVHKICQLKDRTFVAINTSRWTWCWRDWKWHFLKCTVNPSFCNVWIIDWIAWVDPFLNGLRLECSSEVGIPLSLSSRENPPELGLLHWKWLVPWVNRRNLLWA